MPLTKMTVTLELPVIDESPIERGAKLDAMECFPVPVGISQKKFCNGLSYKVKPKDVLEVWEYVCLLRTKDVKPDEINVDSMIGFLRQMKVEVKKETNDD